MIQLVLKQGYDCTQNSSIIDIGYALIIGIRKNITYVQDIYNRLLIVINRFNQQDGKGVIIMKIQSKEDNANEVVLIWLGQGIYKNLYVAT